MAVLMGGQPVGLQVNYDRSIGSLCDERDDDVTHIIFECRALSPIRDIYWKILMDSMPGSMCRDLLSANYKTRTYLLISGLGATYMPEWHEIYYVIADMVSALYTKRYSLHSCV